jgi:hypothetical protein
VARVERPAIKTGKDSGIRFLLVSIAPLKINYRPSLPIGQQSSYSAFCWGAIKLSADNE